MANFLPFFDPAVIVRMTEQDVREEIVAPILAQLGYKFGTPYYVERERALKYPYYQLGRRSRKDVPQGAADYICGLDGRRGCFTIEAKRGNHKLTDLDVSQAHSYATHPEVAANFFMITNGIEFLVYQTLRNQNEPPILSLNVTTLDVDFYKIENLLSPERLQKNCEVHYDLGKPIGGVLGSSASVKNGWTTITDLDLYFESIGENPMAEALNSSDEFLYGKEVARAFIGQRQPVVDGKISRSETGMIFAKVTFDATYAEISEDLLTLGLKELTIYFNSETISCDPNCPTAFETKGGGAIPQGTALYSIITRQRSATAFQTNIEMQFRGAGHLENDRFLGVYFGRSIHSISIPEIEMPPLVTIQEGYFDIRVM